MFKPLHIELLMVGRAGLPAGMNDPHPLERQRADGGVCLLYTSLEAMNLVSYPLVSVKDPPPETDQVTPPGSG